MALAFANTLAAVVGDFVRAHTYGSTVTKSWLLARMGLAFPAAGGAADFRRVELQWVELFTEVRRELLHSHSMALRSTGRETWVVVRPHEQHAHAISLARRKVEKALDEARDIMDHTRVSLLSASQRAQHTDAANKLAAFEALIRPKLPKLR